MHTSVEISGNFDIKHLRNERNERIQRNEKKILRRDTLRNSVVVIGRFNVKK